MLRSINTIQSSLGIYRNVAGRTTLMPANIVPHDIAYPLQHLSFQSWPLCKFYIVQKQNGRQAAAAQMFYEQNFNKSVQDDLQIRMGQFRFVYWPLGQITESAHLGNILILELLSKSIGPVRVKYSVQEAVSNDVDCINMPWLSTVQHSWDLKRNMQMELNQWVPCQIWINTDQPRRHNSAAIPVACIPYIISCQIWELAKRQRMS